MGIYNRDYMRQSSNRLLPESWRATEVIIAINVAVFILWQFGPRQFMAENFTTSIAHLRHLLVWTPITYAFSHEGLWHIVFNMLILWMFARSLEEQLGTRPFVALYIAGAVGGAACHYLLTLAGLPGGALLGASASVTTFVILYACLYPRQVFLVMMVIPIPAYVAAILIVGWDVYGVLDLALSPHVGSGPLIGHGAHLGGALIGMLYGFHLTGRIRLPFLATGGRSRRRRSHRSVSRTAMPAPKHSGPEERRMDELLAKVHQGGLDSLTTEERDFMIDMSKRLRDR